jgi:hypothetical protein
MRTVMPFLLLCLPLSAQDVQHVQTMHDKIPVYGSWLTAEQRRAAFDPDDDNETVWIPEGQTVLLKHPETALDVVCYGNLIIDGKGCLTVRTLQVLGLQSRLDIIVSDKKPRDCVVFRDLPLDTEHDPAQYGHGLVVVDGRMDIVASYPRQPWATVAEEIHAGDTWITLQDKPLEWQPGDVLVLPDTRTPANSQEVAAWTEKVTIQRVACELVLLSAPVKFDHLAHHAGNGEVEEWFQVGNLSQPVVLRSENPLGVRGHVLMTRNADIEARGVLLSELGRTTFALLDSTTFGADGSAAHRGTNQIGRYAWHQHHLLGRPGNGKRFQFLLDGYSIDGSPKWGVAIHGSHYGRVANGCVYNCAGSAIVTEDPWVFGNEVVGNLLIGKQPGSGQRIALENGGRAAGDKVGGDHWTNRVGLGLASAMNAISGNRIYGMNDAIGLAGIIPQSFYYPAERGVCTCSGASDPNAVNFRYIPYRYPFWFNTSDNQVWGCLRGIETWAADCFPTDVAPEQYYEARANQNWSLKSDQHSDAKMFPGLTLVHCRQATDFEDHRHTATYGYTIRGDWSNQPTVGIAFKNGYERGAEHFNADVRGVRYGYRAVAPGNKTEFRNCAFECQTVLWEPLGYNGDAAGRPRLVLFKDCTFVKPAGFVFAQFDPYYSLAVRLPLYKNRPDIRSLLKAEYRIEPWTDGRVLKLYHPEQAPDFALPPIDANTSYGDWPKGVNTHQQLIQLGTPLLGEVTPAAAFHAPEFGLFRAAESD